MKDNSYKLIPRELREAQFPEARFLNAEEQATYDEACNLFNDKRARGNLKVGLNGSNLFKVLFLNQIGLRTATLSELESALENGMPLRRQYEDAPGVVLRSAGDSHAPNDYLAKQLASFVRKEDLSNTLVLEGLKVKEDSTSEYGLSFERGEGFRVVSAPALNHSNHQRKFKRINSDYTLDFAEDGERILYTREQGVSRLYLCRGLNLSSWCGYLASSSGGGRVVRITGEATAKNFDAYLAQLKTQNAQLEEQLKERFRQAAKILKGE